MVFVVAIAVVVVVFVVVRINVFILDIIVDGGSVIIIYNYFHCFRDYYR